MQKVVTLNTCCDIACLTFQLPHITTGSFQSHRWQPTTGFFQSLQRLKERNKPSVRWKSFAFHKLVWWHFPVGRQVDYSLFSSEITWIIRSSMNNTVENDFSRFPNVKWLHLTGEMGKSVRFSCQIFSWFNLPKLLKSFNFWQISQKNKRRTFLGHSV